jgi:4-amino-4-deoxy-L-arabinose transferase
MKAMERHIRRAWLLAIPALFFLYLFGLAGVGLLSTDEPRYAAIGREMARSGDWVTPRLWGEPWFEKPALLYWMTATAFRAGLGENLAPRLPVALLSIGFLIFFHRALASRFGGSAAWCAAVILATSAGWLGCSHVGVTDLPLAAAFSAAMLLALDWIESGDSRLLPWSAALLGAAVLAKGLVPLALALPLAWFGRRRLGALLRARVAAPFAVVALPWYLACYLRNGAPFLKRFLWQDHIERYVSDALQHQQPFWFYLPVLAAALLPWSPALLLLFRRSAYQDVRRRFLLAWVLFGLGFFSMSNGKLPGYVLPLLPAVAALMGIALAEVRQAGSVLIASALCLIAIPIAGRLLPQVLTLGLSRAVWPRFEWYWLLPALAAGAAWFLETTARRAAAVTLLGLVVTAGVADLEVRTMPVLDRAASAQPLWREIAARREEVCISEIHRSYRYGLNYYSGTPLPDCREQPRPLCVRQVPGQPPFVARRLDPS